MGFWKLLASLWRSSGSRDGRRNGRVGSLESLGEAGLLHDSSGSAPWAAAEASNRSQLAEVLHVPSGHRRYQTTRSQSQFIRLSVIIVDFLLEHEWYSLLGGYGRRASGEARERRGSRPRPGRVATDYDAETIDESSRTACVSEARWSIVATIDTPPPDSTSGA